MKTITLDEQAYNLLKAWKKGTRESFSSVVKRVVPEPGTLGALLNYVETERTDTLSANELMEAAVESRSSAKENPWI